VFSELRFGESRTRRSPLDSDAQFAALRLGPQPLR
jgi:hypothetical protein